MSWVRAGRVFLWGVVPVGGREYYSFEYYTCGSHGCNTFFSANESHGFVGGGFDANLLRCDGESVGDVGFHGGDVGHDFRGFCDQRGVNVLDVGMVFISELAAFFEDVERADAFDAVIFWWEVVADVW